MIAIAEYALDDPYLRIPREDRIALPRGICGLPKSTIAAAKQISPELCPIEPEPVEVIEPVDPIKEWVERQRAIPIKKKPWFFVEKDLGPVVHRPPAVDEIITATARHFKFSLTDLMACRRLASVVRARQVAMYLTKVLTTRSFPEIGRRFGGRDHYHGSARRSEN
jgi:hypothetical protein